jgi:hypothetical protein
MSRIIINALSSSKEFIDKKIKHNSIVIDATVGNGYDTCYLRSKLGDDGFLYGFDIQKDAIDNTRRRLLENNLFFNVELILDSHTEFKKYISKSVDIIVYNLGYLPKGNKSITTLHRTSLISVKEGMSLLNKEGIILLTVYPGHDEGEKEYNEISLFLKTVNQKEFEIMKIDFYNQVNNSPILFVIERK